MTLPTYMPRPSPVDRTAADTKRTLRTLLASAAGAAALIYLALRGGRRRTSRTRAPPASLVAVDRRPSPASPAAPASPVPTMRLRSGLEMPAVGYGTCCRESARGEAVYRSTLTFLKSGGRLIDTAMAYRNHAEIGRAVRDSGLPRSDVWITSKVAPGKVGDYESCLVAVDGILKELGMDYLDLLLIHTPKLGKDPTIQLWRCLLESRRLGKAKAIGVSNFNRGEIEDVSSATGETPEANEIQYHPWSTPSWRALADWQGENGIATIAYTSLGGSRFHGGGGWPPAVASVAKRRGWTESQVLLKWALGRGSAVIPGSGSEAHIRENLALPHAALSESELKEIETSDVPVGWWDARRGSQKYTDEEAGLPWARRKNG